jgi:3D (Asp-Asp-Asp) domain-containing protein
MLFVVLGILFWYDPAGAKTQHRAPKTMIMKATAFAHARHVTAAGTQAHEGIVAADPAVLPLGTRIQISGSTVYDGEYLVADTGAAVKGLHIDLYLSSRAEARQFGVQTVRVQIREMGTGASDARRKDAS